MSIHGELGGVRLGCDAIVNGDSDGDDGGGGDCMLQPRNRPPI